MNLVVGKPVIESNIYCYLDIKVEEEKCTLKIK